MKQIVLTTVIANLIVGAIVLIALRHYETKCYWYLETINNAFVIPRQYSNNPFWCRDLPPELRK